MSSSALPSAVTSGLASLSSLANQGAERPGSARSKRLRAASTRAWLFPGCPAPAAQRGGPSAARACPARRPLSASSRPAGGGCARGSPPARPATPPSPPCPWWSRPGLAPRPRPSRARPPRARWAFPGAGPGVPRGLGARQPAVPALTPRCRASGAGAPLAGLAPCPPCPGPARLLHTHHPSLHRPASVHVPDQQLPSGRHPSPQPPGLRARCPRPASTCGAPPHPGSGSAAPALPDSRPRARLCGPRPSPSACRPPCPHSSLWPRARCPATQHPPTRLLRLQRPWGPRAARLPGSYSRPSTGAARPAPAPRPPGLRLCL